MKLNENKEFYIEKKNPKLYRSIDYQKLLGILVLANKLDNNDFVFEMNDNVLKSLLREYEIKPIKQDKDFKENNDNKNNIIKLINSEFEKRGLSTDFNRNNPELYNSCDLLYLVHSNIKRKNNEKAFDILNDLSLVELQSVFDESNFMLTLFNSDDTDNDDFVLLLSAISLIKDVGKAKLKLKNKQKEEIKKKNNRRKNKKLNRK